MVMEMLDGYCHPVLSTEDFIWLVGLYMGDEPADYIRDLLADAEGAIAENDTLQDEVDELRDRVAELEQKKGE